MVGYRQPSTVYMSTYYGNTSQPMLLVVDLDQYTMSLIGECSTFIPRNCCQPQRFTSEIESLVAIDGGLIATDGAQLYFLGDYVINIFGFHFFK